MYHYLRTGLPFTSTSFRTCLCKQESVYEYICKASSSRLSLMLPMSCFRVIMSQRTCLSLICQYYDQNRKGNKAI